MRLHYIIAGLTLALGIALGLVLIPSSREVALMRLRDKDFTQARSAYESQYSHGDHSVATALALTRLYLQTGEISRAIAQMEEVVSKDSENIEARKMLGTLYQFAQRPGDYLRNLEIIARLQPTLEHMTELSNIYNYMAEYGRQIDVLRRLVSSFPDQTKPAVDLAYLLASRGEAREAVDLLLATEKRNPGKPLDITARRTLVSLMLDLGRGEDVMALTRGWLGPDPGSQDIVDTASLFSRRRRPDLGAELLRPFLAKSGNAPEFILMLADMEINSGQRDSAQKTLLDWLGRGPLPDDLKVEFVDRAMTLGMQSEALTVARSTSPKAFTNAQLAQLVELAYQAKDNAFITSLMTAAGDEFLAGRPTLGLELAMARKDSTSVDRWMDRAINDKALPFSDRLGLVGQLLRLEHKDLAGKVFEALDLTTTLSDDQLDALAGNFAELGRIDPGYQFFAKQRREHPSDAAERGWMRLALLSKRLDEVESWLATHQTPTLALLAEVYSAAAEAKIGSLALAAATPLYHRDPTQQNRLWYANALVLTGQGETALPLLRELVATQAFGTAAEPIYIAALDATNQMDELSGYLSLRLARGDLTDTEQADLIYALVDRKVYRGALPLLRERAAWADEWFYSYADVALKAGAAEELTAFLVEDLTRENLTPVQLDARISQLLDIAPGEAVAPLLKITAKDPERWLDPAMALLAKLGRNDDLRQTMATYATDQRLSDSRRLDVAYAALDRLDKPTAIAALQSVAEKGTTDSTAVQLLLYLWGPRPKTEALDWLEARARKANNESQMAGWLGLITRLGAPARTLAVLAGRNVGPLLDSAIEAHAALGHQADVIALAQASLKAETPVSALRRYARMVENFRDNTTAARVWTAVLEKEPHHVEALRQVGMLAYDSNKLKEAEVKLRHYVATSPTDYEAYFFLGETLTAQERRTEANRFYTIALAQLRALPSLNGAQRVSEANLLFRQGKMDQAIAIIRNLHHQKPRDQVLRADLVALYVDRNHLRSAARLLALD